MERDDVVGRSTGTSVVRVERGPLSQFAQAVTDRNPIYRRADKAAEAGFSDVPAPPTFGFSGLEFWGTWPEDQPAPDPDAGNPMAEIMGELMAAGGLILHGEQEFIYHRPVVAGDVLHHEGHVVDLYAKQSSKGRTMTFVVTEDVYRDGGGEPVLTCRTNLIHRA